jgi:hypothetical protein
MKLVNNGKWFILGGGASRICVLEPRVVFIKNLLIQNPEIVCDIYI